MTTEQKTETTTPAVVEAPQVPVIPVTQAPAQIEGDIYMNPAAFSHAQRVANLLASSQIVPKIYQGSVPNCFIAVEISTRLKISPFLFMQYSGIFHGKPAMEAKLLIGIVNASGRYKGGIQFEWEGEGDKRKCSAFGVRADNDTIESRACSVADAKAWGWWGKTDSAWPKHTDMMLAYRAASFLVNLYCPELRMGLLTFEEVRDITETNEGKSAFSERLKVTEVKK